MGRGYRGNKAAIQTIIKRGETTSRDPGTQVQDPENPDADHSVAQTIVLKPDDHVDGRTVGAKLRKHTHPNSTTLMTDDSRIYDAVGEHFLDHHAVNHSKEEYVRQEEDGHLAHTNTAEGYFSNLKRQIGGTHHSVTKKHLPRYVEEHDYKYNHRHLTATEIADQTIGNIHGKRVTYEAATG